jgi:UDP-N-acetylglucosamine--N-acetylmuramyl-(pentapeptide) pyrophosphoryl-undecaprenol N-acetylglucosamine transferase
MKKSTRPLFVFAGGGSGGHLYPALALAAELQLLVSDAEFLFLCSAREVDLRILSHAAAQNPRISWFAVAGSRGASGIARVTEPFRLGLECLRAIVRLRGRHPVAVLGVGARASVAGCLAARILGLPLILLESNVFPGAATRCLSRLAVACLTGLPVEAAAVGGLRCPVLQTGVPVRGVISALHGELYLAEPARPRLLVLGGSQGAQSVNQLVLDALTSDGITGPVLPDDWEIVHQSGESGLERVREGYLRLGLSVRVESYLGDMSSELRAATLVVSRAGAVTLAELACGRRPALLLPLATAAGNHQWRNARYFASAGAGELVDTGAADISKTGAAVQLRGLLRDLSRDADRRQRMSVAAARLAVPDAATSAAAAVLEIAMRQG